MPFKPSFTRIDQIIGEAASECGLDYVRADRRNQPGSILPQILQDIRRAAVVVADISEHNPNVFYELGIAHQEKGPDRVVLITQTAPSPYDVHEFHQLTYEDTETGWAELRQALPRLLLAAADAIPEQEMWNVIRGRLPRTKLLVRAMEHQEEIAGAGGLEALTIRIVAGLGSLAISDREPPDPGVDAEYIDHLRMERDTLRRLLVRGARLRAVLNPPRPFAKAGLPGRLRARYERLIGLLDGRSDIANPKAAADDLAALQRCKFVLSPVPMPNLFIIGEYVAYEGMKRAGTGGFEMTHCENRREGVRELIQHFEQYFGERYREMVRTHPPDGCVAEQLRAFHDGFGIDEQP